MNLLSNKMMLGENLELNPKTQDFHSDNLNLKCSLNTLSNLHLDLWECQFNSKQGFSKPQVQINSDSQLADYPNLQLFQFNTNNPKCKDSDSQMSLNQPPRWASQE